MTDDYLIKNHHGLMILDGRRQGGDRRMIWDRRDRPFDKYDSRDRRKQSTRREEGERRIGPVFSTSELFYNKLSAFAMGCFLMAAGIFMVIMGLTFMPVIGVFIGLISMILGSGFLIRTLRSRWPSP